MKLIHLSDLHLGKRLKDYSLTDDQKYILDKVISAVKTERPDGVIIAGDVYDKAVPTAEAVELFDGFLTRLAALKTAVFVISGNHDSAERIAFGGRIMEQGGIYMSKPYDGQITPVSLKDEYGTVNVYMLPFIKPAHVRAAFPDQEINSYTDALACAVKNMNIDPNRRNVLITHQFVTGAVRSESEDKSVGGSDNVDASVFSDFDYTALGHIHRPQNIGSEKIRYCGTPLKYSFSEANHEKSITIAELYEKGNINVRCIPLAPMRDMACIKGTYSQLTQKSFYENTSYRSDYVRIILTDEDDIPDAAAKLRVIYKNFMELDYDNKRTKSRMQDISAEDAESKTPRELFAELYEKQNNAPMSKEQSLFLSKLIENIWEGEQCGR